MGQFIHNNVYIPSIHEIDWGDNVNNNFQILADLLNTIKTLMQTVSSQTTEINNLKNNTSTSTDELSQRQNELELSVNNSINSINKIIIEIQDIQERQNNAIVGKSDINHTHSEYLKVTDYSDDFSTFDQRINNATISLRAAIDSHQQDSFDKFSAINTSLDQIETVLTEIKRTLVSNTNNIQLHETQLANKSDIDHNHNNLYATITDNETVKNDLNSLLQTYNTEIPELQTSINNIELEYSTNENISLQLETIRNEFSNSDTSILEKVNTNTENIATNAGKITSLESQIQSQATLIANNIENITKKADVSHDHNNLYYTQDEVDNKIDALVNGAPEALNTLAELAEALTEDQNFATNITNKITDIKAELNDSINIVENDLSNYKSTTDQMLLSHNTDITKIKSDIEKLSDYGNTDIDALSETVNNLKTDYNTLSSEVALCTENLENIYNKDETSSLIQNAVDLKASDILDKVYNKEEIDEKLENISLDDVYTKSAANNLFVTKTDHAADLQTKSDIDHNHNNTYYTKLDTDNKLSEKSDLNHNHNDTYYTIDQTDEMLETKSNIGHDHSLLYYNKSDIDTKVDEINNSIETINNNISELSSNVDTKVEKINNSIETINNSSVHLTGDEEITGIKAFETIKIGECTLYYENGTLNFIFN